MKKILAMIGAVCLILTSCSAVNDKPAETSGETTTLAVSEAETTENIGTMEQTGVSESVPDETEALTDDEIIGDDELVSTARQLLGALNYIDRIGGGNIPRDDEMPSMLTADSLQRSAHSSLTQPTLTNIYEAISPTALSKADIREFSAAMSLITSTLTANFTAMLRLRAAAFNG